MQPVNRGFFTIAQNTDSVNYVRLAYGLALSLRHSQQTVKNISIGITPGTCIPNRYAWIFDQIIEIPWGDDASTSEWKLENEWKSIWMSPYDETIKVESDMLFLSDITSWWDSLHAQRNDIVWTNRVLDWKGFEVVNDHYRKTFTLNKLPNIYTGLGYFRKTDAAYDFFNFAKLIFWNWQTFFDQYLESNERPTYPSTDVIFALAMKLLDENQASYTSSSVPVFTHMKSQLQGWTGNVSEDWRKHLRTFFTPLGECKLGNHRQIYPLHYHVKDFLTDEIIETYETLLKHE